MVFCFRSDFFQSVFPNPLIVHSRPSFLFEANFYFSLMVFCSYAAVGHWFSVFFQFLLESKLHFSLAAFWHWFCFFFLVFYLIFFRNGFPKSSTCLSSQWKFFELCVRTCPAMFFCFFLWRSFFVLHLFTQQSWKSQFFWITSSSH